MAQAMREMSEKALKEEELRRQKSNNQSFDYEEGSFQSNNMIFQQKND